MYQISQIFSTIKNLLTNDHFHVWNMCWMLSTMNGNLYFLQVSTLNFRFFPWNISLSKGFPVVTPKICYALESKTNMQWSKQLPITGYVTNHSLEGIYRTIQNRKCSFSFQYVFKNYLINFTWAQFFFLLYSEVLFVAQL